MITSSFQPDRLDRFTQWTIDKIGDDLVEMIGSIANVAFQMGFDLILTGPFIAAPVGAVAVGGAIVASAVLTSFWFLLDRYCKRAKIA